MDLTLDDLRHLVARALREGVELAKRSKNVREQTRGITPTQATDRRVRYAQSVGLKPDASNFTSRSFPQATGNKLPYGGQFGPEHETAHALMTPDNKTLGQYQKWLSARARVKGPDPYGEKQSEHEEAVDHENVATSIGSLVDRRAGVGPSAHRGGFGMRFTDPDNEGYRDEDHTRDVEAASRANSDIHKPPLGQRHIPVNQSSIDIPSEGHRNEARAYVEEFDQGARFNSRGRVQPPGLNARVNAGHAGVTWLRETRAKLGRP